MSLKGGGSKPRTGAFPFSGSANHWPPLAGLACAQAPGVGSCIDRGRRPDWSEGDKAPRADWAPSGGGPATAGPNGPGRPQDKPTAGEARQKSLADAAGGAGPGGRWHCVGRANLVNRPVALETVFAVPRLSASARFLAASTHFQSTHATPPTLAPANHAHANQTQTTPLLPTARDRPDLQPLASSTPAPAPTPTPTPTTTAAPRLARCAVRIPLDVPAAVQCAAFSAHSVHFCRPSKPPPRHSVRSRTTTPNPACQLAARVESGRAPTMVPSPLPIGDCVPAPYTAPSSAPTPALAPPRICSPSRVSGSAHGATRR